MYQNTLKFQNSFHYMLITIQWISNIKSKHFLTPMLILSNSIYRIIMILYNNCLGHNSLSRFISQIIAIHIFIFVSSIFRFETLLTFTRTTLSSWSHFFKLNLPRITPIIIKTVTYVKSASFGVSYKRYHFKTLAGWVVINEIL